MRKWIDIINEAWENTIEVYGQQVDLFSNPSRAEWAKLFRQYPVMRGHIKRDGTLVVWDAMHAAHGDVDSHLGRIHCGYRYFYPDHIMFNDLNMELNEEEEQNPDGSVPHYGWYVTDTYQSTVANPSIRAFYGQNLNIIGVDYEEKPSKFPITAEWIQQNCLVRR